MTPELIETFNSFWPRVRYEYEPGKFKFGWLAKDPMSKGQSLGSFLPFKGNAILLSPQLMSFINPARRP